MSYEFCFNTLYCINTVFINPLFFTQRLLSNYSYAHSFFFFFFFFFFAESEIKHYENTPIQIY